MIEDYPAKRRRARLIARGLLIAGIVLAFASAGLTYAISSRPQAGAPVATTEVVVAARDVPERAVLSAGDLRLALIPQGLVPQGALREVGAAVGQVTLVPIVAEEIVLAGKIGAGEAGAFPIFPGGERPTGTAPDYRAMSIDVPDTHAVGGAVQAGDVVDIVFAIGFVPATLRTGAGEDADFAARIAADAVRVLQRSGTIYTIRVDAAQAERIAAFLAAGTTLHLLLRSGDDTRVPRASGAILSNEAGEIIRAIPTRAPPRP